jgi:uncharacterized protein YyaL (SSP411 family)
MHSQVDRIIESQAGVLERSPHALPTLLRALILRSRGISVAVIIGPEDDPRTSALAARARHALLPDDAVVVLAPGAKRPIGIAAEWLEGRQPEDGIPAAWICQGTRCSLPITNPDQIRAGAIVS